MLIGVIILPRLFLHAEGKEQSDKQPIQFLLQLLECPQGTKQYRTFTRLLSPPHAKKKWSGNEITLDPLRTHESMAEKPEKSNSQ